MQAQESVEYLFVYGTLKRGFDNQWSRRLWSTAGMMGTATVPGALYAVGEYSGFKDAADSRVHGEVARLDHPGVLLEELDAYEGPEYVRTRRMATLMDGRELPVWVYIYQPEVSEKQRIASGRFAFSQ